MYDTDFQSRFRSASTFVLVVAIMLVAGCAQTNKQVAVDQPRAFWPAFPDEPRIQYLVSYESSKDVEPNRGKLDQLIYGKEDDQSLQLSKPYGVRMWKGRIYVCDIRNNCVTALDLRKHQVLVLGKSGAEPLQNPTDLAIAADGTKYVTDSGRGTIAIFDADDKRVGTIGAKNMKPVAAAVYGDELYVCDFQGQSVQVLNRHTGQVLRTIGGPGSGPGQFVRPISVAVDSQGFVFVMDVMKCQLQKFDRGGKLVSAFGTTSSSVGGLVRPKHIAVDRDGIIYVVDAAFQNVQLFNQSGQPLTFFGAAGTHPGAMYLPAGICVTDEDVDLFHDYVHPAFQPQRLLVVTNQFGPNKVAVYALGHLKPGKTVADISASKGLVATAFDDTKRSAPPTTLPADVSDQTAAAAPPATAPAAPSNGPAGF